MRLHKDETIERKEKKSKTRYTEGTSILEIFFPLSYIQFIAAIDALRRSRLLTIAKFIRRPQALLGHDAHGAKPCYSRSSNGAATTRSGFWSVSTLLSIPVLNEGSWLVASVLFFFFFLVLGRYTKWVHDASHDHHLVASRSRLVVCRIWRG